LEQFMQNSSKLEVKVEAKVNESEACFGLFHLTLDLNLSLNLSPAAHRLG